MKIQILKHTKFKSPHGLLEMNLPSGWRAAKPGQFLHLRIVDSCDPLLRRPMSIHDVQAGRIKVLYEIAGKGTELLSQKRPGAEIDVLGPLGNGFDLKPLTQSHQIYIVAGGMGVAPLFFLARKIRESPMSKSKCQMMVLIGARTRNLILGEREFRRLGCEVRVATDDGSKGFHGRITKLLEALLLRATSHEPRAICACGPKPMLAAVAKISRDHRILAQVSLEEFMGCGLGACLGCVIRTTSGYKRICHDGPVFDAAEIVWEGKA